MLKSLFIPHEGFFTEWLDDLNSYFGDVFGILYYPFELLIDFLNRISTINETSTAIIHIPKFTLSFAGYSVVIFAEYNYDLNSILVNDTFVNIHNIYLGVVDIILWLGVVYLASKLIHDIMGLSADTSVDMALSKIEEEDNTSNNHIGFNADISKNRRKRG